MSLSITEETVTKLITPQDAFEQMRLAHVALAKGQAINCLRTRVRTPTMSLHNMSAADTSLGYAAAKIYSATKTSVRSQVLLYRISDGELVATIEANELGRLRTTATAALAVSSLLKKRKFDVLGLIGAGFQAEGIVRSFTDKSSGLEFKKIFVYSRDQNRLKKFKEKTEQKFGIEIKCCSSAVEPCENANVLVTATSSSKPVVEEEWVKNTSQICAIGSNSLARAELAPRVVTNAAKICVDSLEAAKAEGGNLLTPIENGKLQWAQISELGSLFLNPEQSDFNGYSVFCSHGLAIQDLYLAHLVYTRLAKNT